jgi:hypothetical protein
MIGHPGLVHAPGHDLKRSLKNGHAHIVLNQETGGSNAAFAGFDDRPLDGRVDKPRVKICEHLCIRASTQDAIDY